MTQAAFDAFVDKSVRELVPRIGIRNYGSCGTVQIEMPDKGANKKDDDLAGAVQIVRGVACVVSSESCANAPGKKDAGPEGYERIAIEYPPGTWKVGD